MDLEKTYDKICREELWRVLIRIMNSLYDGSGAHVWLDSRVGEYFEVKRELI